MPPKFQSSFIPKGPVATSGVIPQASVRRYDFAGFLAKAIFALSVLLAVGVVGYRWYLGYSIREMGAELERVRAELATDVTGELIRLNDRIVSTESLLQKHRIISPFFSFLETSTPRSVRFTDFNFLMGQEGPEVVMKGEARSYAALALEADALYKAKEFKNPVFSDIRLDERGNVVFSVRAAISPDFLSYQRQVTRLSAPIRPATTTPVFTATSTATTTRATSTATSTPRATTTPR